MQDRIQPTLKVRQIVSGANHRTYFDHKAMLELEEGLRAAGRVTQPIQVRPHPTQADLWEIVAGERRWRAAREVFGDDYDMPVVIADVTDAEARALGIIENHYRDNPSDIEQARGAADLLHFNKGDKEETARTLGWSLDTLARRLLLLSCSPEVQSALVERHIGLGHAELLAGLPHERQSKVLAGIIEHKVPVDVLKKQLGQFARRLSEAIFDTAQCLSCAHNSARQAALFDESIGEGFCQHPSHYEELTLATLEARAIPLRAQYPVVRLVKASDGFVPLLVGPDGPLGVGADQYSACKGCASFGCSLSALPGSYGAVEESLCFDVRCHSTKVAERRRSERQAVKEQATAHTSESPGSQAKPATPVTTSKADQKPATTSNQISPRVAQHRQDRWRAWVANRLMAEPTRNHRVLAALIASSTLQSFHPAKFVEVVGKLVKPAEFGANVFKSALAQADALDAATLPKVVQAVTASAAFGLNLDDLEVLMNYLEVDEAKHFKLSAQYLELLTTSELESLADEFSLHRAMGDAAFKKARSGSKAKFIEALLNVDGFQYDGAVPKAMRYVRKSVQFAGGLEQNVEGAEVAVVASVAQSPTADDIREPADVSAPAAA